ncbi:MAG: Arc family DNA-binding protein [Gammaproteobacteria bacterium]|nr:Arc family DNA-binding protein [Gammaproteobacteria bacterium]
MEMQIDAGVPAADEKEGKPTAAKPRLSVKDAAKRSAIAIPAEFRAQGDKFVVRLPANLRKKMMQISRRHRRSMNSEIILLLGHYLEEQGFMAGEHKEPLDSKLSRKLRSMPVEKLEALLALLD